MKKTKKPRPRCHNCKFAGLRFKVAGVTHFECTHPETDAMERATQWYSTCPKHESKQKNREEQ